MQFKMLHLSFILKKGKIPHILLGFTLGDCIKLYSIIVAHYTSKTALLSIYVRTGF